MLNSLQACRAIAALMIVIAHANASIFGKPKYFSVKPLGEIVEFASMGIDFFFVLSGFLICYAHTSDLGRPRQLLSYFWKRYSRVYLLYWAVLAAVVPIFLLVPTFGNGFERDPSVILTSFLLVPRPDKQMIVSVAWTLPYEMLFYFLFSAFVIHRKLGIVVFALWSLGALCHGFFDEYPLNFVFSSMHLRIVAGVVLCYLFQTYRLPLPRWTLAVGIVLFALTGIGREWGSLSAWEGIAGATLSSVMVIGGCAEADRSGLLRAPGWLVYLGNATYSIYLVHFFALSAIAKVVKASQLDAVVPTLPLFLLHVLCSVGVGCMCYQFLEKPLCEWAKLRFRDAKSQSAAVGAPALHPARKAA